MIRDEVLPEIRRVAEAEKCGFVDLYKALEGKNKFFPDKVHPNKDGASVISKTVEQALKKAAPKAAKEEVPEPAPVKQ